MNHPESCAPPPPVYYTTTSATPIVSNESRADKRVGGPTPISTDTVTSTVAQVEVTQAKGSETRLSRRLLAARERFEAQAAAENSRQTCESLYGPYASYEDEVIAMHLPTLGNR